MDTDHHLKIEGTRSDAELNRTIQLVTNAVISGTKDIVDISEQVGKRKQICLSALQKLIKDGKVARTGEGKRNAPYFYEWLD